MLKSVRCCLVMVLSCMCNTIVFAQSAVTVKGVVIDSSQNKSLQGATVTVFHDKDRRKPHAVFITNEQGLFEFALKDTGSYILEIAFTGFQKQSRTFNAVKEDIHLGSIQLAMEARMLENVTVTGKKTLIETSDDRIIYNVENDPLARSQMALDILRRTPSLSVDGNDTVRMNGQTNFRVLLNGRETAMFSRNVSDALKGFPGSTILRIEVINNPSAKYDAEGIGGIINIVTKKKIEGYNGNVSTWNSSINQHVMSANFNAKFNKLGVAINYGIQTNVNIPFSVHSETIPNNFAYYTSRTLAGKGRQNSFSQYGNAEFSWALDTLNTISFFTNVSGGHSNNPQNLQITTILNNANELRSNFGLSEKRQYPTTTIGTDYIKKFAGIPKKEFSVRFNAELGNSDAELESIEINSVSTLYVNNRTDANNFQYTLQSDLAQPIKQKGLLEVGARTTLRRAVADFANSFKSNSTDDFQINPNNAGNFRFNQDVYSVYSSYSFKLSTFSFRTGVRVEHTAISGAFEDSKVFARRNYYNFLPNFQVSKKIKDLSLVLSYNQRLQRPAINHLNPFIQNNDSLNVSYGNPDLEEQTIHVVTLQTNMSKGKTSFGFTFSSRFSNNMIVSLNSFDPATGRRSSTFYNIGKDFHFQTSGYLNTKFGQKLTLFSNVNFQFRKLKNILNAGQKNSGIAGNSYLGVTYVLNARLNFMNYLGFEQTVIDLQSKFKTIPYCGTAFNYQLIPNKLRAGLMAQNYFARNYPYRTTIKDMNFTTISSNTYAMSKLVFTANWNFGKLKEQVSRRKGVTIDDRL